MLKLNRQYFLELDGKDTPRTQFISQAKLSWENADA